jgi:glucuronoarabinoxylan endo-1,4-beta-xylanase
MIMFAKKIYTILLLVVIVLAQCHADPDATGLVNINLRYQMIEGFGASGAWYENWLTSNTEREEIYDLLFDDLGIDIYRIRNTYDYDAAYMNNTAVIVTEALERNPDLKIMVSSWSPPTYLKSTGALNSGTLIGGPDDYDYEGFAQWWYESIIAWSSYGVNPDYINIQNEPDWDGNDRCLFQPTETVWQKLYSEMNTSMPKMLATDGTGFQGASGYTLDEYLEALPDLSHVYGYAHHLYNCYNGGSAGCGDDPDLYIPYMSAFYANWNDKPRMQTEYESSTGAWPDTFNMALLLHNSLTVENVAAYLYWDLFWATGGLVTLPSYGADTYIINSDYYGFKHYSGFIHSGWQRVQAEEDSEDLRMSAYISPDYQQVTVVIINTNTVSDINLDMAFAGFTISSGDVYRTTSTQSCEYIGNYNPAVPIELPAMSVTTLSLTTSPGTLQTLNISSTSGGSVTTPGEGDFQFPQDCNVTLIATPDIYYQFDLWSGSAVSAGKVADPCSANTMVLMDANYTLVANFEAIPADVTPPDPNPAVWASEPNATGVSTITMTAETATDDSPPVMYYFECVSDANKSSSWQTSTTYIATGLAQATEYSFRVKARDSYLTPNETGWSSTESATTDSSTSDFTSPTPDPMEWFVTPSATDSNSIYMVAGPAVDISGVEFYFECLTIPDHNSGWQDSNSYEDTGLSPDIEYTYRVKARDKSVNHNETGWSTPLSAKTDFKILHRFSGSYDDGGQPWGSLIQVDSKLYGMTQLGGSGSGTIFRINIDGTGFEVLKRFNGGVDSGWQPTGSLIEINGKLYGMSLGGGTGGGIVFRLNTDGTNFEVIRSFVGGTADGRYPQGSLINSGSTLYGFAAQGGASDAGIVFKMNTDGTGFQRLHSFTTGNGGGWPYGTPLLIGSTLYGTTPWGGTGQAGIIFKVNTDGTGFQVLRNFNGGTNNGGWPFLDSLVEYNSMIYGMTNGGGSYGNGIIFRMNPNGTGFQIIHHFAGPVSDGAWPTSVSLLRSGPVFYGMSQGGGAAHTGTIFQINADGTGFQVIHSFTGPDGLWPMGMLHLDGMKLYGMVTNGGGYDLGSIFEMNVPANFSNCPGIIAGGYRLDRDLNSDCYINFDDLAVITGQWLSNNCSESDNCNGADIEPDGDIDLTDFSDFALDWLLCNNPGDSGCIENWLP